MLPIGANLRQRGDTIHNGRRCHGVEPARRFISPTRAGSTSTGSLATSSLHERSADSRYRVIIGTDSQFAEETCFVTAIIVHREGKGAALLLHAADKEQVSRSLRQRIFYETSRSLAVASQLTEARRKRLRRSQRRDPPGRRRKRPDAELIREVVGMVVGSGFHARIKPYSYGASKVADKHTK